MSGDITNMDTSKESVALRNQNTPEEENDVILALNSIRDSNEDTFLNEIFDKCIKAKKLMEEYNEYTIQMPKKVSVESDDHKILAKIKQRDSNNVKYWEKITPVLISSLSNRNFAPVSKDELELSLQLFDFNVSDLTRDIDMSDYVNNVDNCDFYTCHKEFQSNALHSTCHNNIQHSKVQLDQKKYKFFKSKCDDSQKSEKSALFHYSKSNSKNESKYSLSSKGRVELKICKQGTFKNSKNKNISNAAITSTIVNSYKNKVDGSMLNGSTQNEFFEVDKMDDITFHMSKKKKEVHYMYETFHTSRSSMTATQRKSKYGSKFTDISYEERNYSYSTNNSETSSSIKCPKSSYRCHNYKNSFSGEYDKLYCTTGNKDIPCESHNVQYGGSDDLAPGMIESIKNTCKTVASSKSKADNKYNLRKKLSFKEKKYIYLSGHVNTASENDNENVTASSHCDWTYQKFNYSVKSYSTSKTDDNAHSTLNTGKNLLNTNEKNCESHCSSCKKEDESKQNVTLTEVMEKERKYKYFTSKNSASNKDVQVNASFQYKAKGVGKKRKHMEDSKNDPYSFNTGENVSEKNISIDKKKLASNSCNKRQEGQPSANYSDIHNSSNNLNSEESHSGNINTAKCSANVVKESEHKLYSVLTENVCNNIESLINNNSPINAVLTIQYKEGFCQLNEPIKCYEMTHCTPTGIMLLFKTGTQPGCFYYLSFDKLTQEAKYFYRYFFWKIFTKISCTICFGAKEMVTLLINLFSYSLHEVCFQWKLQDPVVACWLLEPDDPLFTFNDIVNKLKLSQELQQFLMPEPVKIEILAGYLPPIKNIRKVEERYTNKLNQTCYLLDMLYATTKKLLDEISQKRLMEIFMEVEMKLLSVLAVMESRGVHVKHSELEDTNNKIKNTMENLEKSASKEIGETVNLNSDSCLSKILTNIRSLHKDADISIKNENYFSSYSVLRSLVPLHPLAAIILAFHHLQKIRQTLQDVVKSSSESSYCAFPDWYQLSTNSGCLPYSELIPGTIPYIEEVLSSSVNLWSICVPRPGYTFIIAAYKHIEFRILAYLSNDLHLQRILQENDDETLLSLAKTGCNEIITSAALEKRLNIILLALMHGIKGAQLAKLLNVTERQASEILHRFIRMFPHVHSYLRSSLETCKCSLKISTLSGRQRLFNNIKSSNSLLKSYSEKQAVDFLIHGSVADIYKAVILKVEQQLAEKTDLNAYLICINQDELVWEVRESDFKAVKVLVELAMQDNILIYGVNPLYSIQSTYNKKF